MNINDIEKGLEFGRKAEYELKRTGEDKGWQILAEGYRKTAEDLLIEVRKHQPNPALTRERMYKLCNRHSWFTAGSTNQYMELFDLVDAKASIHDMAMVIWICSDRDRWSIEEIQKLLDEKLYCAMLNGEIHYIAEFEEVRKFIDEESERDAQEWELCEFTGRDE